MTQEEMKKRTKAYAPRVLKLVESLPSSKTADVTGKQLLRCGASVGANHCAVCRAKSAADFIVKLAIVKEEADESMYWIELLVDRKSIVGNLLDEANQILSLIVSAIKTSKEKRNPEFEFPNPKSI